MKKILKKNFKRKHIIIEEHLHDLGDRNNLKTSQKRTQIIKDLRKRLIIRTLLQ